MARIVETIEREDGHKIAIYESGAQYDLTEGRLVGGPPHARFTPETGIVARDRQIELKRQAVMRGAAKVLENDPDEWDKPTDMDVIEAISEAVMTKALNPKDAKQIDAARYITTEGGYAENQTPSTASISNQAASAFGSELARQFAQIVSDVLKAQQPETQLHDTIDGTSAD